MREPFRLNTKRLHLHRLEVGEFLDPSRRDHAAPLVGAKVIQMLDVMRRVGGLPHFFDANELVNVLLGTRSS